MKYIIMLIAISSFSFFTISCDSENMKPIAIESVLIAQGSLYGNGSEEIEQQNVVITDLTSWEELMTKMNSVNNVTDSFTETDIDFSEYQIIAVFDQLRGNGGHQLGLNVDSDSEKITVSITEINPGGNQTTVITQPYHIVKITKSELPIIFQ